MLDQYWVDLSLQLLSFRNYDSFWRQVITLKAWWRVSALSEMTVMEACSQVVHLRSGRLAILLRRLGELASRFPRCKLSDLVHVLLLESIAKLGIDKLPNFFHCAVFLNFHAVANPKLSSLTSSVQPIEFLLLCVTRVGVVEEDAGVGFASD